MTFGVGLPAELAIVPKDSTRSAVSNLSAKRGAGRREHPIGLYRQKARSPNVAWGASLSPSGWQPPRGAETGTTRLIGAEERTDGCVMIRWSAHCDVSHKAEILVLPAKTQLRWVHELVRGVILANLCRCKRGFALPSRA